MCPVQSNTSTCRATDNVIKIKLIEFKYKLRQYQPMQHKENGYRGH